MKNWNRPASLTAIGLASLTLTACQSTSPGTSSAIEESSSVTQDAMCEALAPPRITREEFNALSDESKAEIVGAGERYTVWCED